MNFIIDEAYLTDVAVRIEHVPKFENTEEGLVDALKYSGKIVSLSHIDHPEFTKLREQLGAEGYIYIERGWWNGDRVLKPFSLNGEKFKKNNKFPCAAAMKHTLHSKYKF